MEAYTVTASYDNTSTTDNLPSDTALLIHKKLKASLMMNTCLAISILLSNGILLLVLRKWKRPSQKMRTVMMNMAWAYIIFSLSVIANSVLVTGRNQCLAVMVVLGSSGHVAITSVLLIALEIHLVSRRTSPGTAGFQTSVMYALVAGSWVLWIVLEGASALDAKDLGRTIPCYYAGPYIKGPYITTILVITLLHVPGVCGLHVASMIYFRRSISSCQINEASSRKLKTLQSSKKMAHLCLLLLILFVVAWGPYLSLQAYAFINNSGFMKPSHSKIFGNLIVLHGLGNFFVYLVQSKEFRNTLKLTLCFWRDNHVAAQSDTDTSGQPKPRAPHTVASHTVASHTIASHAVERI